MKIAFIGFENVDNPLLWAGIPYAILQEFKKQKNLELKVIHAENQKINYPINVLIKRFFYNKLLKHKRGVYRFDRENWFISQKSKVINLELKTFQPNIILCCTPFQIIKINDIAPIFLYTDATFLLLRKFYPDYMRYADTSFISGNRLEKLALNKATHIFYSSKWAMESAVVDYEIDKDKLTVVPFGSNLELPISIKINLTKDINRNMFNILFVGFDYERKGLRKAIKIHKELITNNINSILTIIGPNTLPSFINNTDNIKFYGNLNKKKELDKNLIFEAFQNAHFFILPTNVEAFGIVFCEAGSLGIPSITHSIGGTDEIIKHKVNGLKYTLEQPIKDIINDLKIYIDDRNKYNQLQKDTHQEYLMRLNWPTSIASILLKFNEFYES